MFRRLHLIDLLAAFMGVSACFGAVLTGRVVRVADGDTITVLDAANAQHKIRFHGIDAPESHQAFGQKSKQKLSDYVAGKAVTVTWKSKDKYGRILGTVWLGSTDINLLMLRDGYAWHYKRFDTNPVYAAAESEARAARRGLWSDPNPIPPEQFRHSGKSTASVGRADPSAPVAASASRIEYRAGNAMPVGSRTPAPVNSTWPDTGYWFSTNSNTRHNRNCENYRTTRGYPCSKEEGSPCRKCGG
jgi:endonuclease YncB( thermonuclease family)